MIKREKRTKKTRDAKTERETGLELQRNKDTNQKTDQGERAREK